MAIHPRSSTGVGCIAAFGAVFAAWRRTRRLTSTRARVLIVERKGGMITREIT